MSSVVPDCAAALGILADAVRNPRHSRDPWLERLREAERSWWDEHRTEIESDAAPIHGGHAEHVERPDELARALERALASGQPAIVNVMLDPDAMAGHPYRGM